MNRQECDILNALLLEPYINQRALAQRSGHSLGIVNRCVRALIKEGYLDENVTITQKARKELQEKAPKNAIILAAGLGMRMVPINTAVPKGLLEVNKEPLVERIINQLHEVGVSNIYVVVGCMKEQYEYLIDEYKVELIVNEDYSVKNNLHSMKLVLDHISNTYIIPCDIWCDQNPFHRHELYSWYMVSDLVDNDSTVRVNRKMELVSVQDATGGNAMIGISYLLGHEAALVSKRIQRLCADTRYDGAFWEEALYHKGRMIVQANVVHVSDVVEINTYEQLRELDGKSSQLKSEAMNVIGEVLDVKPSDITNITVLKKGMTNRSFLFTCKEEKYIMRIPGEGTDQMINRTEEAIVHETIKGKKICDDVIYINPDNGYKIMKYYEDARVCDSLDIDDLNRCMDKLRALHRMKLHVVHEFDIFAQVDFYESLWLEPHSVFRDYCKTKENVFSLRSYIEAHIEEKILTHMDAVPDNFLFTGGESGVEEIQLIDWEYAAMQDPHVDIAMFAIYSLYNREQIDQLIDLYFVDGYTEEVKLKIYCYIAVCGLLWSNWCEYKRGLGVEFGEYSLRQYRYAKDFYKIVNDVLSKG